VHPENAIARKTNKTTRIPIPTTNHKEIAMVEEEIAMVEEEIAIVEEETAMVEEAGAETETTIMITVVVEEEVVLVAEEVIIATIKETTAETETIEMVGEEVIAIERTTGNPLPLIVFPTAMTTTTTTAADETMKMTGEIRGGEAEVDAAPEAEEDACQEIGGTGTIWNNKKKISFLLDKPVTTPGVVVAEAGEEVKEDQDRTSECARTTMRRKKVRVRTRTNTTTRVMITMMMGLTTTHLRPTTILPEVAGEDVDEDVLVGEDALVAELLQVAKISVPMLVTLLLVQKKEEMEEPTNSKELKTRAMSVT
jgi:hypothetical protein